MKYVLVVCMKYVLPSHGSLEDSSIVVISSTYSLSHSLPFIEAAVIVPSSHHTKQL